MKFFSRHDHAGSAGSPDGSLEAAAARWLARRELGLLRGDEVAAFERWRKEPQNEATLVSICAVLERSRPGATAPGIVRMRDAALAYRPRGPLLLGNVPAGIAAAILVVTLTAALILREPRRGVPAATPAAVSADIAPVSAGSMSSATRRR